MASAARGTDLDSVGDQEGTHGPSGQAIAAREVSQGGAGLVSDGQSRRGDARARSSCGGSAGYSAAHYRPRAAGTRAAAWRQELCWLTGTASGPDALRRWMNRRVELSGSVWRKSGVGHRRAADGEVLVVSFMGVDVPGR